jgi:hypothetical protein
VSEYQCYEFVALDHPLSAKHMAELREISTRAEISPTRFRNEYHWGDLKADPAKLLERYFDAHLYFANWGTHRLMLRLPRGRVDAKRLKPYFVGKNAGRIKSAGAHVVLDLHAVNEGEYDEDESEASLAALAPLRAELMCGDLRPAYLAWLLAVQAHDVDDDAEEPEVPAGLTTLSAAQRAMVDFLRIDLDLVSAVCGASADAVVGGESLRRWLVGLSTKDKDAWLRRAADEPDLALGSELMRAFRARSAGARRAPRRTVEELRALAETRRRERKNAEEACAKKAKALAEAQRQRRLTTLDRNVQGAWSKLEKLIESSSYDEAVKLAVDLRDLAVRGGDADAFAKRFDALHRQQTRRRGFFDRWKHAATSERHS